MYMKKLLSLLFIFTLSVSTTLSIFAEEQNMEITEVIQENSVNGDLTIPSFEVSLTSPSESKNSRGTSIPSSAYNWNNGNMTFSANTTTTSTLYTNNYFTEFVTGTIRINNKDNYPYAELRVTIYKINSSGSDSSVYTTTVSPESSKTLNLSNYDSNSKYYIEFFCKNTDVYNAKRIIADGYVSRTGR